MRLPRRNLPCIRWSRFRTPPLAHPSSFAAHSHTLFTGHRRGCGFLLANDHACAVQAKQHLREKVICTHRHTLLNHTSKKSAQKAIILSPYLQCKNFNELAIYNHTAYHTHLHGSIPATGAQCSTVWGQSQVAHSVIVIQPRRNMRALQQKQRQQLKHRIHSYNYTVRQRL